MYNKTLISLFLINNTSRSKPIEGLRAFAVIFVLFFHFNPNNLRIFGGGHLGVDIFFVLSGFLIYDLIFLKQKKIIPYIIDRFHRLYPLYFITTFLIWVLHYPILKSIKGFFANLFFIPLLNSNLDYFNYVSWSLGWEWIFYFLIIFFYFFKKYGIVIFLLIVVLLIFIKYLSIVTFFRFLSFFIGCFFSIINTKKFSFITSPITGIISLLFLLTCIFSYGYYHYHLDSSEIFKILFYFIFAICNGFFILYILNEKSFISNTLSILPFMLIGRISYSIYLTHAMISLYFSELFYKNFDLNTFTYYVLTFSITLLIGFIFFMLFERPYFKNKINKTYKN